MILTLINCILKLNFYFQFLTIRKLCEAIENPVPETKTICNPPTETCCPAGQPDCCVKQCYTTNACATERTILPPTSCDTQLPCCDEWSPFGPWSSPTVSCFEASVSRQRYNLCNKEQVQNEVKQIELGDGNFADWTLSQGCSGEVLSSGHQCPGSLQYSRDHSYIFGSRRANNCWFA